VEAEFEPGEPCMAPASTKWLKDIKSTVGSKGQCILKCELFHPANDDEAADMMLKHLEPNFKDKDKWLKVQADCTIFRFCSKFFFHLFPYCFETN